MWLADSRLFDGDANEAQRASGTLFGRDPEDEIFGPVSQVEVFIDKYTFLGSSTMTNEEGKYVMTFLTPPCPPWGYTFKTDTFVKLQYKSFSPHGAPYFPYYLRREDWSTCIGKPQFQGSVSGYTRAMEIWSAHGIPIYDLDFWVDVMFLTGTLRLSNPDGTTVPVGGTTQYQVFDTGFHDQPITQNNYDFDGDGQTDQAVLGNLVTQTNDLGETEEVFEPVEDPAEAEVQGVWLSGNPDPGGQPDIIRQADTANRQQSTGFLSSISAEDLQNTDLMVFREATGELVLERQGLREAELTGRTQIGSAEDGESLFYDLMIRGVDDSRVNIGATGRWGSWTEWATRNQLAEPFREREANHLKPGEWIRLVAINRPTGYIATQRVQLSSAANNRMSLLNVPVDPLVLRPPNLKIWAERRFDVTHGLTAGDSRNYLIGAEGASLTSDSLIQVYTEWLDHDGRPLPGGLAADDGADFGLTGRLAKVVSTNVLGATAEGADSGLANFPIAPGLQTQVIKIRDNLTRPEHYYIHVNGTPTNKNPDFGAGGASAAPLDTRPAQLTPFKTPLYDEHNDWESFSNWHKVNEAEGNTGDDRTHKPDPVYQWHYRPEYQFSRFELEMKDIERQYTDEAGNTHTLDLLTGQSEDGQVPTLRGDDDLVSILYDLAGASFDRLSPIDGPQDLVFSLGGEEVQVTLGDDQQITFKNLEQINRLHPADLLTMRLYTNQDAGNALWEYAFTRNGLHVYYKIPGNTEENNGDPTRIENNPLPDQDQRDDIEIVSLLTGEPGAEEGEDDAHPTPTIRTLGGMRLRYSYVPPSMSGVKIQKATWRINHKGRYCTDYGVEPNLGCDEPTEANDPKTQENFEAEESANIWWEPLDENNEVAWSLWAGENSDSEGVTGTLFVEYTIPSEDESAQPLARTYEQDFLIKTRELSPVTGQDAEPMQGSDVAMLEAMLWQLGISPQYGFKGSLATRIGELSQSLEGPVGGSEGSSSRSILSTGTSGQAGDGSVEKMLCRFNYISFSGLGGVDDKCDLSDDGHYQPLSELGRHWRHYYTAYQHWSDHETIRFSALEPDEQGNVSFVEAEGAAEAAEAVFDGAVSYPDGPDFPDIDSTYSTEKHDEVLAATGSEFKRLDILKAMAQQEASGYHWSAWRITVGNADERGSKGFNQLYNAYTYGGQAQDSPEDGNKTAEEISAYTREGDSSVNHYDARHNLVAKAVWLAKDEAQGGGGSFFRAFAAEGARSYAGTYQPPADLPLRQIETGSVETVLTESEWEDDSYERLSKGLGGYNQGAGTFGAGPGRSWLDLLVNQITPNSTAFSEIIEIPYDERTAEQRRSAARTAAMSYAMSVMHDEDKLRLPHRQYVWQGGSYPEDMPLLDESGNPETDEEGNVILHPNAGLEWCFVYGEENWAGGELFIDVKEAAEGNVARDIDPIGRINCISGEEL